MWRAWNIRVEKWILYSMHWETLITLEQWNVMMKVLLEYEFIINLWIRWGQRETEGCLLGDNCLSVHPYELELRMVVVEGGNKVMDVRHIQRLSFRICSLFR